MMTDFGGTSGRHLSFEKCPGREYHWPAREATVSIAADFTATFTARSQRRSTWPPALLREKGPESTAEARRPAGFCAAHTPHRDTNRATSPQPYEASSSLQVGQLDSFKPLRGDCTRLEKPYVATSKHICTYTIHIKPANFSLTTVPTCRPVAV